MNEEGLILRFCTQIVSGVGALHDVGAIPNDLALRCCQLTSDMTVKVKIRPNLFTGFFTIIAVSIK